MAAQKNFDINSSSSLLPNFLGTLKSSLDDSSSFQETLDKMTDFLCTYTNCKEWSNYVENVFYGNLSGSGICQSSIGQNWCQICTDKCTNTASQYSSYEVMLNSIWALQKLMTSRRAYQYIFNGVFDNTCGFPTMKPIETIDTFLTSRNISDFLDGWSWAEGYVETNDTQDISLFKQLYQKCSKETNCISELEDDLISKLTGQPKIQGSMEDSEDFVLIPLCSFGTSPLENCHLFKASAYKHQKEKCFTFNDNLTTVFENDQKCLILSYITLASIFSKNAKNTR